MGAVAANSSSNSEPNNNHKEQIKTDFNSTVTQALKLFLEEFVN